MTRLSREAERTLSVGAGTRLGHYEIIERIGAGGMGEVYKALDPRLNRTVAIKILHEHISNSPEARARFEREARTIARLNNPHICVVHDVGRHEKTDFLVMELLDGETLARRLERGPVPLNQTLRYAAEIAEALDKAHREGITHRDLKPGNIMLTRSGLKLLDFGLAKLRPSQVVSSLTATPTKMDPTAEGTILGSLHYMAPEQLEAAETDSRTDIFAFGVLLYEMLTGLKAFDGKSAVSVMSAILKDTPQPVSQLLPISPPAVDRLIARCMEKHPDDRWQSAGDLCHELKWLTSSAVQTATSNVSESRSLGTGGRRRIPVRAAAVIALAAAIAASLAVWTLKPANNATHSLTVRTAIPIPPGYFLGNWAISPAALSPDGTLLAYVASRGGGTQQLYVRALDSLDVKPIAGTDGATGPFFSPSGEWIGFFAGSKLKKVPTTGGASQSLCDTAGSMGGTWGSDDTIYYAPYSTSGIWKTRASGGMCEELTKLDRSKGEVSHRAPQALPGGKAILFTVWNGPGSDERHLHVQTLGTPEHHELIHGASSGRYVSSGHILYSRDGALWAVPFDLANLKLNGLSAALAERAVDAESASFTVSDSGTLAYVPGSPRRNERRLVWVDNKGNVTPEPGPPKAFLEPAISPNGLYAAVTIEGPIESIWILEFSRHTLTSFTSTSLGSSQAPVWTRDGKRLAYRGTRKGFRNVFWASVDGGNAEERLTTGDNNQTPGFFSLNDQQLAFNDTDLATGGDIWVMPLNAERKRSEFRITPSFDSGPNISPNGRWLAYSSAESDKEEIYVLPFPGPGGKNYKISVDGGTEPVWSRKGEELFYRIDGRMMAVDMSNFPDKVGSPRFLFAGPYEGSDTGRPGYDVSADGKFLMVQPVEPGQPPTQINLVLHWFEELKRIAPGK